MKTPLPWFIGGALLSAAALLIVTQTRWSGQPSGLSALKQSIGNAVSKAAEKTPEKPVRSAALPPGEAKAKPPATKSASASQAAKPDSTGKPAFDIVRVEEDGSAVIAGRAAPHAKVQMLLDNKVLGTIQADERGEWAFVPKTPLPKGNHQLAIRTAPKAGEKKLAAVSPQTVTLNIPGQGEKPLIVLSEPSKPTRILQKPSAPAKPEPAQTASRASETAPAKKDEQTTTAQKASTAQQPSAARQTASAQPSRAQKPSTALQPSATRKTATAQPSTAQMQPAAAQGRPAAARQPAIAAATARITTPARTGRLALQTVDYDDNGDIFFTGKAAAGQTLRLYVDNRFLADAKAGPNGAWEWRGRTKIAAGVHTLRVDRIAPSGKVMERIELPFKREAAASVIASRQATPAGAPDNKGAAQPDKAAPETAPASAGQTPPPGPGRVVIQPGNNLWNIARVIYGKGVRYTTIYEANKDQIRDPNLIYPGQIFKTPNASGPIRIDPKAAGAAAQDKTPPAN